MAEFSNRQMNDASFTRCAVARTWFVDVNLADGAFVNVNLAGAPLENVNLAGLTVENANIKGMRIFGYDVEAWISEQRARDGCHLD